MKRILTVAIVSTIICSAGMASGAEKEAAEIKFPTKSITYLVPYSAGGSSDQMARAMVKYAKKHLGANLVIENVGGGGGNVGLVKFASNKPDGYSIVSANTSMNLQPIYGTTQYDYLDILEPIALVVSIPIAIAVPKESPYKTIEELIAAAKAKPGSIQYGHAGVGSITHVTAELFAMEAGIKMEQVPFGSGNDALTALMGNHIQVNVAALSEVLGHHKTGTVRILAMCTDKQIENIPTLISKGYKVDMKVTQGISTLKKVDPRIVKILDEGFGKIVNDKDYQKDIMALGMEIDYLNASGFAEFLKKQRATFIRVVTDSGIAEMVKSRQ